MADASSVEPASTYSCCECGRDMTILVGAPIALVGICLYCVSHPGWFREPELRAAIMPGHDGLEVCER